eukprot:1950696-Rhodomonas_salina.1
MLVFGPCLYQTQPAPPPKKAALTPAYFKRIEAVDFAIKQGREGNGGYGCGRACPCQPLSLSSAHPPLIPAAPWTILHPPTAPLAVFVALPCHRTARGI